MLSNFFAKCILSFLIHVKELYSVISYPAL